MGCAEGVPTCEQAWQIVNYVLEITDWTSCENPKGEGYPDCCEVLNIIDNEEGDMLPELGVCEGNCCSHVMAP
jgi:hypothetical protein